jgi:hypothetical protein
MSPQKIRDWEQEKNHRTVDRTAALHAIETLAKKIGHGAKTFLPLTS